MTSAYIGPSIPRLQDLLASAECLLLDFDGPICRLFSGLPARKIAATMRDYLTEHGRPVTDAGLIASADPHEILRAPMNDALTAGLELLLTEAEEKAARVAAPTPLSHEFIQAAAAGGRILAITTNNAPSAVEAYLQEHDLGGLFGPRIFGRSAKDPALMKPNPDSLLRAIDALGVSASECLMIGDSAADAIAAQAANVGFLGYARSADRVARLRGVGAPHVVLGMTDLVTAIRGLVPPNE